MKINQLASWWRPVELVGTPGTPGCPQIHRAVLHFKLETARKTHLWCTSRVSACGVS
jgi:hypothetical protein